MAMSTRATASDPPQALKRSSDAMTSRGDASANAGLVERLRDYAELLEVQGADGFRVAAYRRGADTMPRSTARRPPSCRRRAGAA